MSLLWVVSLLFLGMSQAAMIEVNPGTIDEILKKHNLVMINFSAGWCRYSQALKTVFEKAAAELESTPGVALVYVDCVAHASICQNYRVNKYPTMKFIRGGELMKSEYRGQRSVEAITGHIKSLMEDPVKQLHGDTELSLAKEANKKKFVLGYFTSTNSYSYEVFKASAQVMHGQCQFYAIIGDDAKEKIDAMGKENIFLINDVDHPEKVFEGSVTDQPQLSTWVKDNCVPLVREITFENGEELTEEGLPFVILFHDPEDQDSVKLFTQKVSEQCQDQRNGVNFLHADGFKFAHPLSHLGKRTGDLPVLAIDSFKHMYLFPQFENIHRPGRLRRFVEDLHSGRLHREFHGEVFNDRKNEDSEPIPLPKDPKLAAKVIAEQQKLDRQKKDAGTAPPESVFRKLEPNKNRYSILEKDEL